MPYKLYSIFNDSIESDCELQKQLVESIKPTYTDSLIEFSGVMIAKPIPINKKEVIQSLKKGIIHIQEIHKHTRSALVAELNNSVNIISNDVNNSKNQLKLINNAIDIFRNSPELKFKCIKQISDNDSDSYNDSCDNNQIYNTDDNVDEELESISDNIEEIKDMIVNVEVDIMNIHNDLDYISNEKDFTSVKISHTLKLNNIGFIGEIKQYLGTRDPNDFWMIADGRELLKKNYIELYTFMIDNEFVERDNKKIFELINMNPIPSVAGKISQSNKGLIRLNYVIKVK